MGQPWGLSGPQFLVVYAICFGAIVVVTAAAWQVMRGLPSHRPTRQLDHYETAFLAGGKQRVAEVVIAEMIDRGGLRVNSKGRLYEADQSARGGRFGASVGVISGGGMTTHAVRSRISGNPAIRAIAARLRADGLIMSVERVAVVRWVFVLMLSALLGTGIARMMEGHQNHRPIGDLESMFAGSVIIGLWVLSVIFRSAGTTRYGRWYLRRLRRAPLAGGVPLGANLPGLAGLAGGQFPSLGGTAVATAAVFGVALWGFKAIPDQTIRAALLAGQSSSSRVSGCGGGGCGGGCGGGGGGGCGG